MNIARRIYVSLPADPWLPENLNRLKWGIVEEIEKLGYTPEIFTNPKGKPGLASAKAWNPRDADDIARRCSGAAILGMPRWRFQDGDNNPVLLPTEFNHYEGAMARTLGLPTLVLVQRHVLRRVVFDMSFGGYVGEFQPDADVDWLHTDEFRVPFNYWKTLLNERRDVFLGYCSSSAETASAIKRYLLSLGARVLDWQTDFIPGRTVIDQIEQAAMRSIGGIFLFTRDDDLADKDRADNSVPRDNVVFEAGYFIGLKGKRNVLIVRETGSKMPADLGGDIYASLLDKSAIAPIERNLAAFMNAI
ncbi:nucleotide-binding protein [Accumulibacter sp.]|uniref:nucleotide-binding protein n=1 Tax=Accumulibacter sp. TaxID=2053492 RepID=UPI001AD290C8|nr:nucleotide-binding protein [Accumulibacter sp.]MBN8516134.1 nucleotide-binding protein [Accumulibacter sp.]MBO3702347.1 nucleotide-binding protein [Accumulibacter sp.]